VLAICAFVLVVVPLSLWWNQGILWGDEAAYRFEAKTFASGHLTAVAPLPTSDDSSISSRELRFTHHIVREGRWFTKYPPLWPAAIALGEIARVPWLVNPVLALVAALLVFRIGKDELGLKTPAVAVCVLLSSPFFFLMAASSMSHMLAEVLVIFAVR